MTRSKDFSSDKCEYFVLAYIDPLACVFHHSHLHDNIMVSFFNRFNTKEKKKKRLKITFVSSFIKPISIITDCDIFNLEFITNKSLLKIQSDTLILGIWK